jgi:hypothetical protein
MKKLLLASLLFATTYATNPLVDTSGLEIAPQENIVQALSLEDIDQSNCGIVYRHPETNQFHVIRNNTDTPVEAAFVDKEVRNMDNEVFTKFIESGGYLRIVQMDDGNLALHANMRGLGGGFWGAAAGFWTGKILVHVGSQLLILGASAAVGVVCPFAAPAVYSGLTAATAIPVEAASNVVGLATGITGAVITGPV